MGEVEKGLVKLKRKVKTGIDRYYFEKLKKV